MSTSLYQKYRPRSLKTVIGQDSAVASVQSLLNKQAVPHCIMFTGDSGCGKTTIARILKEELVCGDQDFVEINCADKNGIDMVREIRRGMRMSPLHGNCRIYLLDEVHMISKEAQNGILKILEDTPKHSYFFLCTTDPQKLIKTIHTRSTQIKLPSLTVANLAKVILRVVEKEKMQVSPEVINEIAEASDGSARKALVLLEQVGTLGTPEEQIAAISTTGGNKEAAINLARALISPGAKWPPVAAILKDMTDDPESVRYLVLGYSRTVLLGGGALSSRAFKIIDIFSRNFYDSKNAGLAAACWEVINCN